MHPRLSLHRLLYRGLVVKAFRLVSRSRLLNRLPCRNRIAKAAPLACQQRLADHRHLVRVILPLSLNLRANHTPLARVLLQAQVAQQQCQAPPVCRSLRVKVRLLLAHLR